MARGASDFQDLDDQALHRAAILPRRRPVRWRSARRLRHPGRRHQRREQITSRLRHLGELIQTLLRRFTMTGLPGTQVGDLSLLLFLGGADQLDLLRGRRLPIGARKVLTPMIGRSSFILSAS